MMRVDDLEPPFPYPDTLGNPARRLASVRAIRAWMRHPAVRRRTARDAIRAGHGDMIIFDGWRRQIPALRSYLRRKSGRSDSTAAPLWDLDEELVAAANFMTAEEAGAFIRGVDAWTEAVQCDHIDRLWLRGAEILDENPRAGDLNFAPPGVDWARDTIAAAGLGAPAALDVLMAEALAGRLNWRSIPPHVANALRAKIQARARDAAREAGMPEGLAEALDADSLVADLLASPEAASLALLLKAALDAARAVLDPAPDPTVCGPFDFGV